MYIEWWIIALMSYLSPSLSSWDEYIKRGKKLDFWVFAPLIPPTAFMISLIVSMIAGDVLGYGGIAFFGLKFVLWIMKKCCTKKKEQL